MTRPDADPNRPIRLVFLISGGGRTMQNVALHARRGQLNATIEKVIASNGSAGGLTLAHELGIPSAVVRRKDFDSVEAFSDAVWSEIGPCRPDLVCMGGYLSLLLIPSEFEGRVINIHPGLLPAYGGKGMYGHHVHEAVIAAGEKVSGCTLHFADNQYDHGPTILRRTCPVLPEDTPDTLAARVFEEEKIAYPEAIRWFMTHRMGRTETAL